MKRASWSAQHSHTVPLADDLREDTGAMSDHGSVREFAEKSFRLTASDRTVSVIIACYDLQRISMLMRAVQSVYVQDYPNKLTVVVDYNEDLYRQVLNAVPEDVSVIRNMRSRGAAGARNTAAIASDCDLLAFLDDDAYARAGWLRSLVEAMDEPGVIGVGGRIVARWQKDCPRWFPPEFGWVVGASFPAIGSEAEAFPVRNVWSGSMMVERQAFQTVNGFREDLSKVGGASQPEDTELCLRVTRTYGAAGRWLMVPLAVVDHYVPTHRATLRYVIARCWSEGTGKVRMRAMMADHSQALAAERVYLSRTIPFAVWAGILSSLRLRNLDGLMRSGTAVIGVGAAVLGALTARILIIRTRHI